MVLQAIEDLSWGMNGLECQRRHWPGIRTPTQRLSLSKIRFQRWLIIFLICDRMSPKVWRKAVLNVVSETVCIRRCLYEI